MRTVWMKSWRIRLAAAAIGTTLFLEGCDPTIRTTVEDGLITLANSFLTALLQAFLQAGSQAA